MSGALSQEVGSFPTPVANTLTVTETARAAIADWITDDDPVVNQTELLNCLMTLVRMGGRGWRRTDAATKLLADR